MLSETDAKLEAPFLLELRLWHVTLLSSGLGLALVSALCCLVRVRSVSPSPLSLSDVSDVIPGFPEPSLTLRLITSGKLFLNSSTAR